MKGKRTFFEFDGHNICAQDVQIYSQSRGISRPYVCVWLKGRANYLEFEGHFSDFEAALKRALEE